MIEFPKLEDFVNRAHYEVGNYRIEFILSPHKLLNNSYAIPELNWSSIRYGEEDDLDEVPDDKRGLYAFGISHPDGGLPPHIYIMYVGIAGEKDDSDRSLRDRYKEYLRESTLLKRERIGRMVNDWKLVLKFFFAPVDDNVSSEKLMQTERQLNSALMPPFSVGDLEAETKRQRRAFQ